MARRTITILTDDLDGTESEEVATISFGLNGDTYAIDLTPTNAERLEAALERYVAAATRVGGRPGPRAVARPDMNAIRTWANSNGYQVGDRGRIPTKALNAYNSAN